MTTTTAIIALIYSLILLGLAIGAYQWLKKLAAEDRLFVCFVPLNEAVGIRRGGTFHRFLFDPTSGTHLNDPRHWQFDSSYRPWERLPNTWKWHKSNTDITYKDERNWFTRLTGIYFFLPFIEEVDYYPFDWTTYIKTEIDPATGKKIHITKPHVNADGSVRKVRSIYAQTVQYYGQVMVLTQDGIDVLVNFTFDVDLVNPFVARFDRANFLGQVKSRLEAELRNYVGEQGFAQLFSETDSGPTAPGSTPNAGGHGKFYEERVQKLNKSIEMAPGTPGPGIEELYGITLKAVHILDIQDPTGHSAKQVAARQALKIAEKDLEISELKAQEEHNKGKGEALKRGEINRVDVERERALMEIRTGKAEATQIAMAEAWFKNATVVSVGDKGITPLLNLPANTATAPAGAGTTTT